MPDPRMIPVWRAPRQSGGPESAEPAPAGESRDLSETVVVRPFLVTRGRTTPVHAELRIETLVQATTTAQVCDLRFEARAVVELTRRPRSVAEIAIGLGVPLGVARILIDDLVASGHVTCHQSTELPLSLLERIRDRVRAL